jgi:hypothetical protein
MNDTGYRHARRLAWLATATVLVGVPAFAQEAAPAEPAAVEEVVVIGVHATQRSSVETKRSTAIIVDAITNDGIGARAVSFQQFPSELVNGVLVYETQSADFVEGGVSGAIELRTLHPLEARKRLRLDLRGVYNPYDSKIAGRNGLIGLVLGHSRVDSTQPEDFYTASSSFQPCNTEAAT